MTEAVGSKTDVVQRFVHQPRWTLGASWDTQNYDAIHSPRLQTHSVFMGTGSKCQRSANVHKMPALNTQSGWGTQGETGSYCRGEQMELGAGIGRWSERGGRSTGTEVKEAWPEEEAGLREGLQEEVGGARPWEQRVCG